MADDDIREGNPEKTRKKKAPPPDDEDDEQPRKKKKVARADADEEESDLGSSPLSALIPVGGSIFALLSLWLSVISLLLAIFAMTTYYEKMLSCVLPALWPISLICGGLAFFTHKHKASYGSIAGNMRAVIGILISLAVMVMHLFLVFIFVKGG
jgi:hypothetical protein